MTASGTEDFIYDNDGFDGYSIYMNSGVGYAGETFEIAGPSQVNTIWIYNSANNTIPTQTEISGYGLFGSLYNTEPMYTEAVSLTETGWNEISLAGHEWSFDGRYIIAYQISDVVNGELDITAVPSEHSVFRSSGAWVTWLEDSEQNYQMVNGVFVQISLLRVLMQPIMCSGTWLKLRMV